MQRVERCQAKTADRSANTAATEAAIPQEDVITLPAISMVILFGDQRGILGFWGLSLLNAFEVEGDMIEPLRCDRLLGFRFSVFFLSTI